MREVYVLVVSQACDGDQSIDVLVFETFDKANELMLKQIKQAKEEFENVPTEEDDYVDGDMSWAIWEEGEYCMNHFSVEIYQRQVL